MKVYICTDWWNTISFVTLSKTKADKWKNKEQTNRVKEYTLV